MSALVVKASAVAAGLFAVLNILMLLAGQAQAPETWLTEFAQACMDRPQPCWYGIVPGVTTVAETQRIVLGLGYTPSRRSSYGIITYGLHERVIGCTLQATYDESTGPIRSLHFRDCTGIRVGDLIMALGRPDWMQPQAQRSILIYETGRDLLVEGQAVSPYSPVTEFNLHRPYTVEYVGAITWRGFVPRGHSCRQQRAQYGSSRC